MNDNISEVLGQFAVTVKGFRLLSWKGKKGVWAVRTNQGLKILKRSPASKARQIFLNAAVRQLRSNGAPVPELSLTHNGAEFAENNGNCYTLSEAVRGRSPEYESPLELRQIMQTLGRFHLASRGFTTTGDGQERMHLGKWEDGYERHLADLAAFKEKAKRESTLFSKLYLNHVDTFIKQGHDALQTIRTDAYREWVQKVSRIKNLCHQDFASGNLILTTRGLYVIDMDSLTFDLPARDLRKILNKVMKKKGWRMNQTVAMLRAYQSVHPLTADEYGILKADLLFPHLFYGIASKHFKQRRGPEPMAATPLERLGLMIRADKSKMNVLNRWDVVVRQVTGKRGGTA